MKHDWLKWGALAAALVATASAEYELARAVGFNQYVAAAVPGALDLYTVRALRSGREVLAAVAAMIGVNAASHLVTAGLLPVNVPLVVAVAAIAPLVLWRVHSLGTGHDEPETSSKLDEVEPTEVTATVAVERIDDDQPKALPQSPEVVPAGARMLPIVAQPGPGGMSAEEFDALPSHPFVGAAQGPQAPHRSIASLAADRSQKDGYTVLEYQPEEPTVVTEPDREWSPVLDDEDQADDHDRADKVTTSVGAEAPRPVVTKVVALTPSELRRRASKLNRELVASTGRPVTIDRLREEYNLSRREAAELRREVVGTVALVPGEVRS
jgi:hypothetical protein